MVSSQRGLMKGAFEYICKRERMRDEEQLSLSSSLVDNHLSQPKGTLYRKNLLSHYGCVNAIEFSENGSLLASGGDDRRILIWNVHQTLVGNETPKTEPIVLAAEHRSNVFALAFVSSQQKIISAGNDDQVIVHDIQTGQPVDYLIQEQPVFGVSCDPLNDNIFTVAGDDGRILIYDMRDSSNDPFCLAKYNSSFHSVMFHPIEPRLILSSNAKEGAALWDVRMSGNKVLLKYGRQMGDSDSCMNARFNRNGSQVLSLRRRLPPVLYSTQSSSHLFQFNHPSYYNSCTMKSCSFGGSGDEFVMAGSDNFDLHIWKIPTPGSNQWVNEASLVVKGHRSIVNQVRYNYTHHLIASSGVEKMIKIWSPFAIPDKACWNDDEAGKTSESPRQIFSHEEYVRLYMRTSHGHLFSMSQSQDLSRNTDEDSRMLAFFDALVQRDIAGLSEDEDSDADSTYTNTVYSTDDSSSNDDDIEPIIGPMPQITARSVFTRRRTATLSRSRLFEASPPSSSDENNSDDEPRLLDMEDLPIVESSSDSDQEEVLPHHSPEPSPYARHEYDSRSSRVPSVGTSEPNTLTNLIATRGAQLRKLASNNNTNNNNHSDKSRKSDELTVQPQFTSQAGSGSATGSDSSSGTSSSGSSSPLPLRHRSRRRSIQLTPIYESSSSVPDSRTPVAAGPGYQLINNLMTRNLTPPLQGSTTNSRSISMYSSSSSSSSSSSTSSTSTSDDDNTDFTLRNLFAKTSSSSSSPHQLSATEDEQTQDLLNGGGSTESNALASLTAQSKSKKPPSRKTRVINQFKNPDNNSVSNGRTMINTSDSSTLSQSNVESLIRKRKRKKKPSELLANYISKRLKSGTSDSGIDVSKSDADLDVKPVAGCSYSPKQKKPVQPQQTVNEESDTASE